MYLYDIVDDTYFICRLSIFIFHHCNYVSKEYIKYIIDKLYLQSFCSLFTAIISNVREISNLQGQKVFGSITVSDKAIRDTGSALKWSQIEVLT